MKKLALAAPCATRTGTLVIATLASTLLVVYAGSPAAANPAQSSAAGTPQPAAAQPAHDAGYLRDVLAVDVASVGAGLATRGVLLVPGYLLAAPTVHWLHGNRERAMWSLTLRVATPVAFAAVGYGVTRLDGHRDTLAEALAMWLGAGLGMLTAATIDAAFLTRPRRRKRRDRERAGAALLEYRGIRAIPNVSVGSEQSMSFGVSGTF